MTTPNKSKHLSVSLDLINDKLNFTGTAGDNPPVSIDYYPPLGDGLGYTSLELFLLSLGSCVGSAVLVLLRRMGKNVRVLSVHASGNRREQHPTCFSEIMLHFDLTSPDASGEDMKKALALADQKLCPVWAMVEGNVMVKVDFQISHRG